MDRVARDVLNEHFAFVGTDSPFQAHARLEAPSDATDYQADAWWLWTIGCALEGRWAVNDTVIRKELLESPK